VPDAYLEDLCFDAQQAAEKPIKALFVRRGEKFPYTHDLKDLLKILERNGV
jgi:HEPN domain-containing protein